MFLHSQKLTIVTGTEATAVLFAYAGRSSGPEHSSIWWRAELPSNLKNLDQEGYPNQVIPRSQLVLRTDTFQSRILPLIFAFLQTFAQHKSLKKVVPR